MTIEETIIQYVYDLPRSEKGEVPVIEKSKCIKCYCCQEFCPADAIKLNGRMFKLTGFLAGTNRKI